MNQQDVLRRINEVGVIPVVRAASAEEAIQVVEAIKLGGLSILEITMTVPGAVKVIEEVANRYGDEVVVGAGTVLYPETAQACILAGARFVVSPALNIHTIELCRRSAIAVFPGALTPTEVVTAWQAGADAVKVFPCGAVAPNRDDSDGRRIAGNGSEFYSRRRVCTGSGCGPRRPDSDTVRGTGKSDAVSARLHCSRCRRAPRSFA